MASKRWRRLVFTSAAVIVMAAGYALLRRWLGRAKAREASPDQTPAVTMGEREAAWAAAAAIRLAERRGNEAGEARDSGAAADARADDLETQLDRARRLLSEHTATSNENHRLRGAVQALTDALTAMSRGPEADIPAAGLVDALQGEIDGLREELAAMELQVKELSEDRDRIVDEADRLRTALDAATDISDPDRLGRLRTELAHVRRSLDIERQRNLRLGRRRRNL
jgi:chromosome segregation ATPase